MLSLFKKVKNSFTPEVCILEKFIQNYGLHISEREREIHKVPHVPGQEIIKENKIITFRITQEECKDLQENFTTAESLKRGESEQSYFGKIAHEGRLIGFYLGKSYHYGTYWARFWLE